jgi:hydrogenase maturation protease
MAASTVIVGAGNAYWRDDGAGLAIARRLMGALPGAVRVLVKEGDFASLGDEWQGADAVIVIDATSSGLEPGTIRRYEGHERPLPSAFSRSSTHSFGVAEAIELARALDGCPRASWCSASRGATSLSEKGLSA